MKRAILLASIALSTMEANTAIVATDLIVIDFGDLVKSAASYNYSTHGVTDVADLIRLSDGVAIGVAHAVIGYTS